MKDWSHPTVAQMTVGGRAESVASQNEISGCFIEDARLNHRTLTELAAQTSISSLFQFLHQLSDSPPRARSVQRRMFTGGGFTLVSHGHKHGSVYSRHTQTTHGLCVTSIHVSFWDDSLSQGASWGSWSVLKGQTNKLKSILFVIDYFPVSCIVLLLIRVNAVSRLWKCGADVVQNTNVTTTITIL